MLDKTHLLYMLISGLIGACLLIGLRILGRERVNRTVLALCAILTIALHYSPLWVDFLKTGTATVSRTMLFLIHPCHICMWLLLLSVLFLDKDNVAARLLKDFTFFGGTVCGAIGTILNENYANTPDLGDYVVLKGLLSHSVMVCGCILLLTAGYVKIRVGRDLAAVAAGLTLFVLDGLFINWLFARFDLPACNAMYLQNPPYPSMPWLNAAFIGGVALLVTFLVSALYEQLALPPEERWYRRLFSLLNKHTHTESK